MVHEAGIHFCTSSCQLSWLIFQSSWLIFERFSVWILDRPPTADWGFHCFPHTFHTNSGIIPEIILWLLLWTLILINYSLSFSTIQCELLTASVSKLQMDINYCLFSCLWPCRCQVVVSFVVSLEFSASCILIW